MSEISEFSLPLRDSLVAGLNETRAPTSRKYLTGEGIMMPI